MVNGSGRKLVQTRRRAAAPLILYIRADPALQHLRDHRASMPAVLRAAVNVLGHPAPRAQNRIIGARSRQRLNRRASARVLNEM